MSGNQLRDLILTSPSIDPAQPKPMFGSDRLVVSNLVTHLYDFTREVKLTVDDGRAVYELRLTKRAPARGRTATACTDGCRVQPLLLEAHGVLAAFNSSC